MRDGVPSVYDISRFLRALSELEAEQDLETDLEALRGDLLVELPGFGQHLGYVGKGLPTHATERIRLGPREAGRAGVVPFAHRRQT